MRDFFIRDWIWKLASLAFAIVIWVTVFKYNGGSFEPGAPATVQNTYDCSVSVFSGNADPRTYQIAPNKVSVVVSGSKDVMDSLAGNQIHAFVDLSGVNSAKDLRPPVNIALPKGVTLVSVDPSWVGATLSK